MHAEFNIFKLVFGLPDHSFCECVILLMVALHYLPNTMVWAIVATICRNNPFNEDMLGNSLVEGLVRIRLFE